MKVVIFIGLNHFKLIARSMIMGTNSAFTFFITEEVIQGQFW
jgi:hypothetical protein